MSKSIIFDIDDTLSHPNMEFQYKIIGEITGQTGYAMQDVLDFWRKDYKKQEIVENVFKIDKKTFWDKYDAILGNMERWVANSKLDNNIQLLKKLRNDYKLGAVSNGPNYWVWAQVKNIYKQVGENVFESVISSHGSNNIKSKPNPEGILMCMEELGVKIGEAVYIGNSEGDMKAAKAAGLPFILMDLGWNSEIKHDYSIKNLGELEKVLESVSFINL